GCAAYHLRRELRRIDALVFRRTSPDANRHVGPVRVRIISDEDVGAKLDGRQVELAAGLPVPQPDRQKYDSGSGNKQSHHRSAPGRSGPEVPPDPDEYHREK